MIDTWILKNLNLNFLQKLLSFPSLNLNIEKYEIAGAGYPDCAGSQSSGWYQDCGDYPDYADWGDYNIHNEHANYSRCGYQCQVNQYLNQYIGTPDFNVNDVFIYASLLNNFIDYINLGINKINELVTTNNLEEKYKISPNLSRVSISDIYYATTFNTINDAINKFINGTTNILDRVALEDKIYITELQTFKIILQSLKIPETVPRSD